MKLTVGTVLKSLDREFANRKFSRQSGPHRGQLYYRWINEDTQLSVAPDIRSVAGVVHIDTPHIGIRFDKTEDLAARFQESHPNLPITAEDLAWRTTIGIFPEPQGVITGFFRKTWNIWRESDIEPAASDYVKHIMRVATPFWDKYSDPEAALDLLRRDDEEARNYTGADHFCAERAVAMTFLRKGLKEARQVAGAKLPNIRSVSYREEFRGWMTRFLEAQGTLDSAHI